MRDCMNFFGDDLTEEELEDFDLISLIDFKLEGRKIVEILLWIRAAFSNVAEWNSYQQELKRGNSINKLDERTENLKRLRAKKLQDLLNYVYNDSNCIRVIADEIGRIEYDPDDDKSRANVVLCLYQIINAIRFIECGNYSNYRKKDETWNIVKEQIGKILCDVEPTDYLLIYTSIHYQHAFLSDIMYFEAFKKQIGKMKDEQLMRFLSEDIDGNTISDANDDLMVYPNLDDTIFRVIIRRMSKAKSELVDLFYASLFDYYLPDNWYLTYPNEKIKRNISYIRDSLLKKYGVSIPYLEDEYGIPFEDEYGDYVEKSDEFRAMEIKKMEESDEFKKYTEMLLELSDFEFMKHIIGSNYLIYTEELYGDEEQKFRKIIAGLPDDNLAIVLHTVHKVRPSDSPIIGIFIDIAKERGILGKDIEKFSDINFEDDGINRYEEIAVLYKDMLYFTGGFSIIGVPLDYSGILVKSSKWIYDIGSSDPEVEEECFRSREIAEKGYEF